MISSLYRSIPILLSLILSEFIYINIDKKYEVTNKISSKLHIKQEWKTCFCICCAFIGMLIIGVFGIYVIDIPELLYSILSGILMGTSISIVAKMSHKNIE
jgi:hypothetical protein